MKNVFRLVLAVAAVAAFGEEPVDGVSYPDRCGAVYDGVTDCADAIQKCLDLGGTIRFVGSGTARVDRTVHIRKSGTWLKLDKDFCVMLGDQVNAPILDTPGAAYFYDDPRVNTERLKGLTITGGIFDGNARNQTKGHNYLTPVLRIIDVDDFHFEKVWLRNPRMYAAIFAGLDRFQIRDVLVHNDFAALNCDGLHFGGHVYNGLVENITGNPADDMIGLNVGGDWKPNSNNSREEQARVGGATNVVIRNLHCEKGCFRAVRLLCNDKYPMDDVTIDGVTGECNAMGGLIGLTNWSEPAHFGRIRISNVFGRNTGTAYSYFPKPHGTLVWIGNDASRAEMKVDCTVDSLVLSRVEIGQSAEHRQSLVTLPKGARIGSLKVSDVTVTGAADLSDVDFIAGTPTNGAGEIGTALVRAVTCPTNCTFRAFAAVSIGELSCSDCSLPRIGASDAKTRKTGE